MAKTYRHIILGKFNNGIIDNVPINIRKMWDRWNNNIGHFKIRRIAKREKQAKNEMIVELMAKN